MIFKILYQIFLVILGCCQAVYLVLCITVLSVAHNNQINIRVLFTCKNKMKSFWSYHTCPDF